MTQKKQQGKQPPSTKTPPPVPTTPDATRTDADVDAVAHYFVRRFGTISVDVDFGSCEESTRLIETIPHVRGWEVAHAEWQRAMDDLATTHQLSFEEVDAIASGANGEVGCALEEGYRFGVAVGRQLGGEDAVRGDEDDELAALQRLAGGAK